MQSHHPVRVRVSHDVTLLPIEGGVRPLDLAREGGTEIERESGSEGGEEGRREEGRRGGGEEGGRGGGEEGRRGGGLTHQVILAQCFHGINFVVMLHPYLQT